MGLATAWENGPEYGWSQLHTTGDIFTAAAGHTFCQSSVRLKLGVCEVWPYFYSHIEWNTERR